MAGNSFSGYIDDIIVENIARATGFQTYFSDNNLLMSGITISAVNSTAPLSDVDVTLEPQNAGKLRLNYSTAIPSYSMPIFGTDGKIESTAALDSGSIIIGSTGNLPVAGHITAGAGITVLNTAGNITISAPGSCGTVTALTSDSGDVIPLLGIIDALGGENIGTTGVGNDLTINLNGTTDKCVQIGNATGSLTSLAALSDGKLIIGSTGNAPVIASLTSLGSTIIVSEGAGTLNLEASAAIPTTFTSDAGSATPALNSLAVSGGTNVNTSGAAAALTLNLDDEITLTTVNATTFDTNIAAAGSKLSGTTLQADGTDANISLTLTPKGTGSVNITNMTEHALPIYGASGALSELGPLTNGQILIGSTGADATASTLSNGNNITVTSGAGSASVAVTGTTDKCLQVGNATGSLTSMTALTNGQLAIGSTGNNPVATGLISTDGSISVTQGAGSIDIEVAASGGTAMTWSEITTATKQMVVDEGYLSNDGATKVVFTLPATATKGQRVAVVGHGSGLWKIAQNASQIIYFGNQITTNGTSGYLESTLTYDAIELICITANTTFAVRNCIGNITGN